MALTISAAPTVAHLPPPPAPPRNPDPPAQVPSSAGSQTASLDRLLSKYRLDQANGAAANVLSGLGRQILAAAKASGQHITLPRAPALAGEAAAPAPDTGKVDVTA